MKIRIAIIGCGGFAKNFINLFKIHPEVEKVYVCDLIRERAEAYSKEFDVEVAESFEEVLASDEINSVAIFTQRYKHGPMVIEALKAGKHVYSAVPGAISVDEIKEIEKLVRETRLTYSMGETGVYRAAAMFCRREMKKGTFGKFVYGEAQYNHDIRNMEESFRRTEGDRWKEYAGIPPFYYPTHSTAMVLSAMPGVYVKQVCAMGCENTVSEGIYGEDNNIFKNPFANETMLCKLSNGGIMRISENRSVGWRAPETYITQFYGTDGGYEFSVAKHYLSVWDEENHGRVILKDVSEELTPEPITKALAENYEKTLNDCGLGWNSFELMSPIQDKTRLPEAYKGLGNGHNGTHHYLIDDFCKAAATGKLSPVNIWEVARYNIPGLVAHESALQGGTLMDVPYLGEKPDDWEVIDPYDFEYNQKEEKR